MPVEQAEGAIVFSDIVGFTEFTANFGDERALALVDRQEALVSEALPPGGRIVKQLGDGLLLFFGDAHAAFDTCVSLAKRYAAESTVELPLWVRTGLHFGRPRRRRRDDLIGHDVNLTARVADLAAPGELLCTAAAVEQVAPRADIVFTELAPVVVKGIAEPVRVYRAEPAEEP